MPDEIKCPLCGVLTRNYKREPGTEVFGFRCDRCSRFDISQQAIDALKGNQGYRLSSVCRRSNPDVSIVTILSTNISTLLQSLPNYSPTEKLDNCVQIIGEMTPGQALGVNSNFDTNMDWPLLMLSHPNELNVLFNELENRNYIDPINNPKPMLTMKGWERLQEIQKQGRQSTRCFVAMSFASSMNELYNEAIRPAIELAGYDPLRIDKIEHVNRIDDEIIAQIKRSRFMVADFTGQRHGVYFEAGMMQGIGRTVIWMCNKAEVEAAGTLHFDVRQFNFIDYSTIEEAKNRLYQRILAIEGEGPLVKHSN